MTMVTGSPIWQKSLTMLFLTSPPILLRPMSLSIGPILKNPRSVFIILISLPSIIRFRILKLLKLYSLLSPLRPGPRWDPPPLFKSQWHIVGNSVKKLCHEVFETKTLLNNINDTFLCLIPKFPNANNLRNFRPISLCNTIYKVITKIIANRIKPYLVNLISPYKTSFLKGQHACDNAILIEELMIHITNTTNKTGSLILKLDL